MGCGPRGLSNDGAGADGAGAPAGGFSIKAAKDFDPLGNDGQEDPQQVSNIRDGDASTSWSTEMYVDFQRDIQPGDVVRIESPGGGGYGSPGLPAS